MNKGSIVERLCSDLIAKNRDINRLLYFTFTKVVMLSFYRAAAILAFSQSDTESKNSFFSLVGKFRLIGLRSSCRAH